MVFSNRRLTGDYPKLGTRGEWEEGSNKPNWDDETIIEGEGYVKDTPKSEPQYGSTPSGYVTASREQEDKEEYKEEEEDKKEYKYTPRYSRREAEAERLGTALEREKLEAEREALQRARRKAGVEEKRAEEKYKFEISEAKFKRRERTKKEISGAAKGLQKFLTLGGMPATSPKQRKEFYFGKPNKDLYVPSTPSVTPIKRSPAGAAHKVDTSELKARTVIKGGEFARRLVEPPGKHSESFDLLRRLNTPSGNSPLEQLVLAEIKDNNDHDTMEHIKAEVSKKGYSRQDIEKVVRLLESRGFIEKQRPALPSGQPEYILR